MGRPTFVRKVLWAARATAHDGAPHVISISRQIYLCGKAATGSVRSKDPDIDHTIIVDNRRPPDLLIVYV